MYDDFPTEASPTIKIFKYLDPKTHESSFFEIEQPMLRCLKNNYGGLPERWKKNKKVLDKKTCILFLWVNKQLGDPILKDIIKYICRTYFYFTSYTEEYFCNLTHDTKLFYSILNKRVNILHEENDAFLFNLSCALIAAGTTVKIICVEGCKKFDKIFDICDKMELYVGNSHACNKWNKQMLIWDIIPRYWYPSEGGILSDYQSYVIYYNCGFSKKNMRRIQTIKCKGILFCFNKKD